MNVNGTWNRLRALLQAELRHLTTVHASDRPWQMPLCAALASGLPLFIGAYFDHLDHGLIATLGGLVFLYTPETPLYHRLVSLMACAFGMSASYALGVMAGFFPLLLVPMLTFIAIIVTMVCRYYSVPPPGGLFFIMAASIGAFSAADPLQVPLQVGLVTMGCLLACLIAFFYSLYVLRTREPLPVKPRPRATFDYVVFDSVVIGVFVGISLMLAQLFQVERPYWVPVSCLAVIQGASLRAAWNRHVQRIIGTAVGLLVAWGLMALPLDNWTIALTVTALAFIIETMVVRHYGIATVFITPLTIFLAEAAHFGLSSPNAIIVARFYDTALGCVAGMLGAICLHNERFRTVLSRPLKRLAPARLRL